MLRRLYDWVLHWAETPYGTWALFFLALAESSFFPIPPDVLLIALAISIPAKSFRYALVCTVGSLIGGVIGYLIGYQFMELVGLQILEFYGLMAKFNAVGDLYNKYNALAVGIAGFTPIPYKVFTISAGAFGINFPIFLAASAVSRAARFFIVGWLIYKFGPGIRAFIDRYFNILAVVFVILLVGGFILIRYIF
ncbi:MAG: DedA family protein [Deltaproteobacteria bacterium]|nr:DedA family protein [Deltaproteobacteria bacterium]MBN2846100.1 DedA family protein [Deltaproteobacteria bacterium]